MVTVTVAFGLGHISETSGGTFLLSWVGDLYSKFLPDNRESCAKADLPKLYKHDFCLSQAGTCPRAPLELIL